MTAAQRLSRAWHRHARTASRLAAVLAASLSLSLSLPAAEPPCEIVIGSCHRPPLSAADGSGVIDRIAIEAFHRIGRRACITQLPCERSLLAADSGAIDGDILRVAEIVGPHYPNLVGVPEVLYPMPMNCFAVRRDMRPKELADLAALRVGYIIGWKILEDKVRAAEVLRVRGPEQLFPLLADGRADVVVYERLTGQRMVEEMGLKGIRVLEPPLLVTPQYLTLHERHRTLVAPLAAALRAMKADGSYDRIFRAAAVAPPETPR
jgi:polar amino acid transport system substrate-binding protein